MTSHGSGGYLINVFPSSARPHVVPGGLLGHSGSAQLGQRLVGLFINQRPSSPGFRTIIQPIRSSANAKRSAAQLHSKSHASPSSSSSVFRLAILNLLHDHHDRDILRTLTKCKTTL